MPLRHFVLFFGLALSILSCGRSETHMECKKFIKKGELNISLVPDVPIETWRTQYLSTSSSSFLFIFNHVVPSVEVYEMSRNGENIVSHRQVKIATKGIGGINQPISFYAYSPDSILVVPKFTFGASKVYSRDSVRPIANVEALLSNGNLPPNPIGSGISGGIIMGADSSLYVLNYPINDIFDPTNISEEGNEFSFKIKDGVSTKLGVFYPNEMRAKSWPINAILVSRVKGHNGSFLYNWPVIDDVFVYDRDHKFSRRISVESSFAGSDVEPLASSTSSPSSVDLYLPMLTSTYYPTILYDEYRNIYYRFARHRLEYGYESPDDLNYNSLDEQPFSVIVMDTSFNIICEEYMEDKVYDLNGLFIGEQGLYLPRSHPLNNQINEDVRSYDIYSFNE